MGGRKSQGRSKADSEPQSTGEQISLSALRRLRTIERNKLTEIAERAVGFERLPEIALRKARRQIIDSLDIAQRRFGKLQTLDERVVSHPSLTDIDEEIIACDEFSSRIHECIAKLTRLSADSAPRATSPDRTSTSSSQASTHAEDRPRPEQPLCMASAFKLDISPEIFDGDRLRYRAFITQFRNWVGKSTRATPIDRLAALRKHLKGEPKNLVESLDMTDENYEVALKLLDDNFGQVNAEYDKLHYSSGGL